MLASLLGHRPLQACFRIQRTGLVLPTKGLPISQPCGLRQYASVRRPRRNSAWVETLNRIPHKAVIYGLLAAHGVVFLAWQTGMGSARNGDPELLKWMGNNFTTSLHNLREGRWWTIWSSSISHNGLGHLLFNSFTLYFIALPVAQILGTASFLALYFGGATVASVSSVAWHYYNNSSRGATGASGAIYATASYLACKMPRMMFYLYAVIPIPAWAFIPGIFAWEIYSAASGQASGTDHAGHLGGLAAGILYFLVA